MTVTPPRRIRFFSIILSILILLLGGFWTFSVFQAKHLFEKKLSSLKEQGQEIRYETLKIHQFFPIITLKATGLVFENLLLSNTISFSIKIDSLLFSFSPFSSKQIKGSFDTLTASFLKEPRNIIFGPTSFDINFSSESFYAMGNAEFINIQTLTSPSASLENLYLSLTPQTLRVKNEETSYETPGLNITGSFKKLSLNQSSKNIGPDIENISFTAFLMEKIDLSDFPKKSLKTILSQWKDRGGALDIEKATLSWGDLTFSLEGTLALDDTLNPEGSFTSTVKGIPEFLKHLSQNQTYSTQDRLFLELSLGFLSGTSGEITLPLTLQNQILRLGNFINVDITPLSW
ncbi:MAG: DUF2125 domain-containing protein [Proteobacteria bacterium]|nr:DUF2125 domain-containing protein [Pseudomonadota bacterium]